MTPESRHVSIVIARPPAEVYDYTSEHANLPHWASGIGDSIERVDGDWVVETPDGRLTIRFADRNDLGVLDHTVRLPNGDEFSNPMRVVPHDGGSEVVFSLRRVAGQGDEEFDADKATILGDLRTLKAILEGAGG